MAKLTRKQQLFVDEYLIDLNATQAAIRAGYSVRTANEQGAQNLAKLSIQQAIAERMAERSRRTGAALCLRCGKPVFAIQSVKVKVIPTKEGEGIEREVKLSDKLKALELLGKHLGMWNDKLDVSLNVPVVISGEDALED